MNNTNSINALKFVIEKQKKELSNATDVDHIRACRVLIAIYKTKLDLLVEPDYCKESINYVNNIND